MLVIPALVETSSACSALVHGSLHVATRQSSIRVAQCRRNRVATRRWHRDEMLFIASAGNLWAKMGRPVSSAERHSRRARLRLGAVLTVLTALVLAGAVWWQQ